MSTIEIANMLSTTNMESASANWQMLAAAPVGAEVEIGTDSVRYRKVNHSRWILVG